MKFQPPKGTRDLLPEDAARMQRIIDIVRGVFERYGYKPLFTPAFESFELLSAKGGLGEAVKNEIYYFKDKSKRELGLRFDLTMPLARVASSNPQMAKPFKRYQIDKVWRYDNPQAMRYREFWQADVDIVGVKGIEADAEIIAIACDAVIALGFKDFTVRVNDRRVLDDFLKSIDVSNSVDVFRAIDKLEKIGEADVRKELKEKKVDDEKIDKILKFIQSGGNEAKEFKQLMKLLKAYGCDKYIKVDFSLVRGLEYYTGPVFEINLGANVSCGGGGRYDNLIKTVGGADLPATGISLGLDRIFEVMKEDKMLEELKRKSTVFVANVGDTIEDSINIAQKLRDSGAIVQTNVAGKGLKDQLAYASKIGVDYALIVGEKELKSGEFVLRDMKTKNETTAPIDEIIKKL